MTLRLAHLSDLHFDGSAELVAGLAALLDRVRSIEPDVIVVTGDLTAHGRPNELDAVADALLAFEPIPRVVVPGNRDLVPSVGEPGEARALPIDADFDYFLAMEPALSLGLDGGDDPGAGQSSQEGEAATPEARWIERFGRRDDAYTDDRVHIVAVDSNPRLRSAALEAAARRMRTARPGALRVFALHHGLLPVPGRKLRDGDLSHRSGDAIALLLDLDVDVALHGHVHRAHAWQIGDGRRSMVVASAGALVNDGRLDASFLEILVEDGRLTIYRRSVATARSTRLFDGSLRSAHGRGRVHR